MILICVHIVAIVLFFMSLPQPSKLCAKKECFKNISISRETCNEKIGKVDSLRADCLNSAYDDKFEHLLNKDSDFDIDCLLTLDEQCYGKS